MSSDIQKLADRLRALAKDTSGVTTLAYKAAVDAGKLADRAQQAGTVGVNTTALAAQLEAAASKARDAGAHIERVQKSGEHFATHLASKGSGGGIHPVEGVLAGAAGIAIGALIGTSTMDVTRTHIDLQSGKDPNQTVQKLASEKLDNDENMADVVRSLREIDELKDRIRKRDSE